MLCKKEKSNLFYRAWKGLVFKVHLLDFYMIYKYLWIDFYFFLCTNVSIGAKEHVY